MKIPKVKYTNIVNLFVQLAQQTSLEEFKGHISHIQNVKLNPDLYTSPDADASGNQHGQM